MIDNRACGPRDRLPTPRLVRTAVAAASLTVALPSAGLAAPSEISQHLTACLNRMPAVATIGGVLSMEVRFDLDGSLAFEPTVKGVVDGRDAGAVRLAANNIKRCTPLRPSPKSVRNFRDWSVVVVGFGQPRSDASPRTAADPDGPPASLRNVTCQAIYRMGQGVTEAAWRQVSNVPISELSMAEALALKQIVAECGGRRKNVIAPHERDALRLVEIDLSSIVPNARAREATQRREALQRQEAVSDREARQEARSDLRSYLQQLASLPPNEACRPTPEEIRRQIAGKIGERPFDAEIAPSSDWTAIVSGCQARDALVLTNQRRDKERREAEGMAARNKLLLDYATNSRLTQQRALSVIGIPADVLARRLILTFDPMTSLLLLEFNHQQLTLADWLAMFMTAQPDAPLRGIQDARTGDWGFSFKNPGARTISIFVHLDGDELFLSQLAVGDAVQSINTPEDTMGVSSLIMQGSGMQNVLNRPATARTQRQ